MTEQYTQKLLMTGMLDFDPIRKTSKSVTEVSVIEGPARAIASFSRCSLDLKRED